MIELSINGLLTRHLKNYRSKREETLIYGFISLIRQDLLNAVLIIDRNMEETNDKFNGLRIYPIHAYGK